jgi:hypothetical protein
MVPNPPTAKTSDEEVPHIAERSLFGLGGFTNIQPGEPAVLSDGDVGLCSLVGVVQQILNHECFRDFGINS